MIRIRHVVFLATAAAGALAFAAPGSAQQAAMDHAGHAACETAEALGPEYAGWLVPASALRAAERPAKAGDSLLAVGTAASVALAGTPSVRYAVQPSKPGGSVSFGGILAFDVPEAGRYRIAQDGRSWVDVVEDGAALSSTAHGHGPACSGISKMVDFDLEPGRHLLQVSANGTQDLKILVMRLP